MAVARDSRRDRHMCPIYRYRCNTCREAQEVFRKMADHKDTPACECGGATRQILSLPKVFSDIDPYYDENLESHITSKKHRRRVMAEQGVEEAYGKGWT